MPEFLAGLLCMLAGATCVAFAMRRGGRAIDACTAAGLALQALVVASAWFDWGYSWLDETAIEIASLRNVWILMPHGLALLVLAAPAVWGRRALPHALAIAAIQAGSFEIVLYLVGMDTDRSFFAPGALVALYASALSCFMLLPAAMVVIPAEGSHWWVVAFGRRQALVEAIRGLATEGLDCRPPRSMLESGEARGRAVAVTTEPSALPPAYALRVRVARAGAGALPALPAFAPRESWLVGRGAVEYLGLSKEGFDVDAGRLAGFVRALEGKSA